MKTHFISLIFSFILFIQQLPLKQISDAIYERQNINEELPNNDAPPSASYSEEISKHFVNSSHQEQIAFTERLISQLIQMHEQIYSRFADDVETRPPNAEQSVDF